MKYRQTVLSTILLVFSSFALSPTPTAFGVLPAPDGGYPNFNTAEGQNALFGLSTGAWNTALGTFTLYSDTSGPGNTAVGTNGLYNNVTGGYNTAVGLNTLYENNGANNCAFGSWALFSNTTGYNNCALGSSALNLNINGIDNTATGTDALVNNHSGNYNTAAGVNALFSNTTGSLNIALGYYAGGYVTTGSYNIYIGTDVRGAAGEVGHTYISNIKSTQQNLSPVTVDLTTGLLGHEFSSQRYKEDVKPMSEASEALFALKPVTYRYKKEIDKSQAIDYGFIAEEVAKVDPELAVRDGKGQIESVRYNAITAMLLNEFLKEHRKVQKQEVTIARLQSAARDQQKNFEFSLAKQKNQIEALASSLQGVKTELEVTKRPVRVLANNP